MPATFDTRLLSLNDRSTKKVTKLHELVFDCVNLDQTDQLGQNLAEQLQPGLVIGLDGTLGSGKTRLVQAIAKGLGITSDQVVSPTFTICVPHSGRLKILHVDAYRINHEEEVDELGLDEDVENGRLVHRVGASGSKAVCRRWIFKLKRPPLTPPVDSTASRESQRPANNSSIT